MASHIPDQGKSDTEAVTLDLVAERIEESAATAEPDMAASPAESDDQADDPRPGENSPAAAEPVSERPDERQVDRDRSASEGAPKASRGGFVPALFGGVVALVLGGGLVQTGLLPLGGPAGVSPESLAALETRLATAEGRIDGIVIPPAPDLSALDGRIAALEAAMKAAEAKSSGTSTSPVATPDAAELQAVRTALDGAIATERARIDTLDSRLSALESKAASAPQDSVTVARAVATAALKSAIDRGGPFLAELDTLESLAAGDADVAALKAFATGGVQSRADLAAAFPDVASAMLSALKAADPERGFFDRLVDSASDLVRVRPVGVVEGEGPDAIIARIEAALGRGDLKSALLEWNGLPDAAKAAGKDWQAALDARFKVEGLMTTLSSRALTVNGQQG